MKTRLRRIWERTIGMRLAIWLDGHTDWCWADLCVDLGLGYAILDTRARDSGACRRDCNEMGSCWCGKFCKEVKQEPNYPRCPGGHIAHYEHDGSFEGRWFQAVCATCGWRSAQLPSEQALDELMKKAWQQS